jgi:hypothetical protein
MAKPSAPRKPRPRKKKGKPTGQYRDNAPALTLEYLLGLVGRSTKQLELRLIWRNVHEMGMLSKELRQAIIERSEYLTSQGITQ